MRFDRCFPYRTINRDMVLVTKEKTNSAPEEVEPTEETTSDAPHEVVETMLEMAAIPFFVDKKKWSALGP